MFNCLIKPTIDAANGFKEALMWLKFKHLVRLLGQLGKELVDNARQPLDMSTRCSAESASC